MLYISILQDKKLSFSCAVIHSGAHFGKVIILSYYYNLGTLGKVEYLDELRFISLRVFENTVVALVSAEFLSISSDPGSLNQSVRCVWGRGGLREIIFELNDL